MPWARRTAVWVAVLAALHLVAAAAGAVGAGTTEAYVELVVAGFICSLLTALSLLVVSRAQGGAVGLLLGVLSLAVVHVVASQIGLQWLATQRDPQAWAPAVAFVTENGWWVFAVFGLLLLHFPDGRVPSRRWAWVPATLVVCAAVQHVFGAFETMPAPLEDVAPPFGPPPLWFEVVALVAFVLLLLLVVACAVSLVLRYRRSEAVARQQIKWLALAGIGMPLYPPLCLAEILVLGEPHWLSAAVGVASLVATPVAATIAVLRHDLYDVDKAIAITVTWVLLTAVLIGVYVAASSGVGVLVGRSTEVGAAVGTAAVALLLLPTLRAVRRAVDARVYPLRRAALTALDTFHREVSAGGDRPERLAEVLRTALRDPGLRVGFRVPGSDDHLDADGAPVPSDGVPVSRENEQIGVLVPGSGPASTELLREVADRCTTLVEIVRLRSEVAQALREARSSRARLVEIGYEERRRIERDLHDGAQQRLVALGMRLLLAQRHLDDGTVAVDDLLDESVAELGTAVAELRQIAHGLRPSSLDDGLPAALSHLCRNLPMTVDLQVDDHPLPDPVATTAYYVASEAITNAVKHAEASRIVLQVERRDDRLLVRVTDDGRGGARLGLRSGLVDRVAALGGSVQVSSPEGRGTEVEASLPCAS